MARIAICKIPCMGDYMLVMGICRQLDDEDYWFKYQFYTCEAYYHLTVSPSNEEWSSCRTQEDADKQNEQWRKLAASRSKWQGRTVKFDCLDFEIEVHYDGKHDFNVAEAKQYEISKEKLKELELEMGGKCDPESFVATDAWEQFDDETWAK